MSVATNKNVQFYFANSFKITNFAKLKARNNRQKHAEYNIQDSRSYKNVLANTQGMYWIVQNSGRE